MDQFQVFIPMNKKEIQPLEGLEGIYDLIMSDDFFREPDADSLLFETIEQRYEDKEAIGEGGMKSIRASYDAFCQRSVARAELKKAKGSIKDFIHEARVLARLEHSSIVPLYDLAMDENGEPYFTMRLLGGENLESILKHLADKNETYLQNYPREVLLEIFLKVCDAISYAHSRGILHMDLKPANIQVDEFGEVLVCDWGLARILGEKEAVSHSPEKIDLESKDSLSGYIKGSPGYMAPEQIDRTLADYSVSSDIYSLGAVLYSLLTYQRPLGDYDLEEVLRKTLLGDILEPRLQAPGVYISESLNAVVMKAMATQNAQRYQTVQGLANEVRAFNNGFATRAEQASFITLAKLMVKRYRFHFISLMSFIFVFIVTVTSFLYQLKNEKNEVVKALDKSRQSETKALESETKALESEQASQQLVTLLKQEKEERFEMRNNFFPKLINMIQNHQNSDRFSSSMVLSRYAMELDPSNDAGQLIYAYNLFGHMKFTEVLEALETYTGDQDMNFLLEPAKRFSKRRPSVEEFVALRGELQRLPPRYRKNLDSYLIHTMTEGYPLNERLNLARKFLHKEAVSHSYFELKEDNDSYALSLHGNKTFESIVYLRNLPLSKLNLSNTLVFDLSPIKNTPLIDLDISNTRVVNIKELNTSHLQKMNLSGTLLSNLRVLRNSPIKHLILNDVWIDLKILQTCRDLETLEIPKGLYGAEYLESLQLSTKIIRY